MSSQPTTNGVRARALFGTDFAIRAPVDVVRASAPPNQIAARPSQDGRSVQVVPAISAIWRRRAERYRNTPGGTDSQNRE